MGGWINPLCSEKVHGKFSFLQESADESKKYMQEIHQLQVKLHAQSDLAFNKFKKAAMVGINVFWNDIQ